MTSVDFTTAPHPGMPTDMQPQLCVMLALASGCATVRETVFENRFSHVPELARMGAGVRLRSEREVVITGTGAAPLTAADVRARPHMFV